jgi:hypothetical protein
MNKKMSNLPAINTKMFTRWEKFLNFISRLDGRWIFRGQRDAEWQLSTSLERTVGFPNPWFFEDKIIEKFKFSAPDLMSVGHMPQTDLEWLAMMQHHGAPTRLLDWTFSPYVAAYFSLEKATSSSVVFAVDLGGLVIDAISACLDAKILDLKQANGHITDTYFMPYFNEIRYNNKIDFIVPMMPEFGNPRLSVQQGLFLYPGNCHKSFEENLATVIQRGKIKIYRLVLDPELRLQALTQLKLMNVTRASLYPGLDGLAQSLFVELALAVEEMKSKSSNIGIE